MDRDELILTEIRELRAELREYMAITVRNENDLKWAKGSMKIGATLIAAAVSAVVSFAIKYLLK